MGYSRSDCSGVRTRTVTLMESDWPMVSVTVSWNLYTPDVRFDTMIWSSKFVFCIVTDKYPTITDGSPYISQRSGSICRVTSMMA